MEGCDSANKGELHKERGQSVKGEKKPQYARHKAIKRKRSKGKQPACATLQQRKNWLQERQNPVKHLKTKNQYPYTTLYGRG